MLTVPLLAWPVAALALSALEPPAITAKASDSQLYFSLPPTRVESICASDLFALEQHTYVGSTAWVCLRAEAVTGRLNVTNWGYLDGFQGRLIRGPVTNDRGVIFAVDQDFVRLDPLTLDRTIIGTMSPPVDGVNYAMVIDVPPGAANAVLINTPGATELRTFPGGQFLRTVIAWPQSGGWPWQPAGNFLTADRTLVAVPDYNNNVSLIDPATGAVAQSFPNLAFGNWAHVAARSAAGIDSLVAMGGEFGRIAVDRFAPWSTVSIGSSNEGSVVGAAAVDWAAGEHDVVGMWDYALRVFNPATMAVCYEELIPYDRIFPFSAQLFAVDADGDGLQEVFWTDYGGLYFLPHGGPSRELQGPSEGFQVAGVTGTTLVTAEKYNTDSTGENLNIVFRDTRTLEVKWRRMASPLETDSRVRTGSVAGEPQPVLFTLTNKRIAAERVADGTLLWELDNPFQSGNDWIAFTLPTGTCASDSCARLLVASNAADTATKGAYLWLIDSTSGKTLWQSVPQGGLGGGNYLAIALADVNGDGVPDLLDARNDLVQGWLVEAIDGNTFQTLWTKDTGNAMPRALGVATKGPPRIGLLLVGSAELLDSADGHTLASQPVAESIYANCCSIQYDAFAFGQGIWVILGGAAVQWLDVDFAEPAQSIDARGVSTEISRGRGAMFAAGVEGVYRIQFPRDDVFNDDMED